MITTLLLISAFLSLFLSGLVFLKKNKGYSNFLLGFWLLFTTCHLFLVYIQHYNSAHHYPYPWIIGADISLIVIHPIWIFIYILSYTRPKSKNCNLLWHLVPFLILNIILSITFYTRSSELKIQSFESALQGTGYIDKGLELSILLVICTALGYLFVSYWLLRKHRKEVKKHYSTLQGVDLKWLRVLLYCIALVIIVNTLLEWVRNYLHIMPVDYAINIGFIFIIAGISYVGLHGIKQTTIFTDLELDDSRTIELNKGTNYPDAEKTGLLHENMVLDRDYEKLILIMDREKPFLDVHLNLSMLAKQTGFRSRYLSQIINQKSGKNFFDFVNSYRIEEFKKRIKEPNNRNFTFLSIAYDCGFNSKATFNRVFKNQTGYTPSEFFRNPHLD